MVASFLGVALLSSPHLVSGRTGKGGRLLVGRRCSLPGQRRDRAWPLYAPAVRWDPWNLREVFYKVREVSRKQKARTHGAVSPSLKGAGVADRLQGVRHLGFQGEDAVSLTAVGKTWFFFSVSPCGIEARKAEVSKAYVGGGQGPGSLSLCFETIVQLLVSAPPRLTALGERK